MQVRIKNQPGKLEIVVCAALLHHTNYF